MKCIEKDGDAKRVSDSDASKQVRAGWKYCSKKLWREKKCKDKPVESVEVKEEAIPEAPKSKYRQKKFQHAGSR